MKGKDWIYYLIITIVFVSVYTYIYDSKIAILGDNATYYILGKGLSEFEGYVNYASPSQKAHNHFPPGYPFFISIIMTLFSDDIQTIKIFNGVLTLTIGLITYLVARKVSNHRLFSFTIALLVILHSGLLYYSSIMMSEVLFCFLSLISIYLLIKLDLEKSFYKNLSFFIFLGLLVFSFYTRAFGIALMGSAVVYFLFRRKYIYMGATFFGFLLGILPWQIRSIQLGGSNQLNVLLRKNYYRPESGTIELADLWERILINLERIVSIELPDIIMPILEFRESQVNNIFLLLVGLAMLSIVAYGVKNSGSIGIILGSYLVFTLIILLIWPDYFSSYRYLVPVIPMLLLLFFYGLYSLINKVLQKYISINKVHPAFLFVFVLMLIPSLKALHIVADKNYPIQWAEFFAIAEWSKNNTENEAVICSRKPSLFYLFSKRLSVNYIYTENTENLIEGLNQQGVDYVVFDQLGFSTTPRCLGKAIMEHRPLFNVIQSVGPEDRKTYFFKYK